MRIDVHDVVAVDRYGRLAQGRTRHCAQEQGQFLYSHFTESFFFGGNRCAGRLRGVVAHQSPKLEGAYQDGAVTAHRVGRLRTKTTGLDSGDLRGAQKALRERIHPSTPGSDG